MAPDPGPATETAGGANGDSLEDRHFLGDKDSRQDTNGKTGITSCPRRFLSRYDQQDAGNTIASLRFQRRPMQILCSGLGAAACAVVAIVCHFSTPWEHVAEYSSDSGHVVFSISEEVQGPITLSYLLVDVMMNSKQYISSKDPDIFGSWYNCEGAADWNEVHFRRSKTWPYIDEKSIWRPCGMVSLSFFDDSYRLEHCGSSADKCAGTRVPLDESGVSLPADDQVWKRLRREGSKYVLDLRNGSTIETWLPNDERMVEHFKVWSRQPVSTVLRNLWATSQESLKPGVYKVIIEKNEVVWLDRWKASKKSVVLAQNSSMGSAGACSFLTILAMVVAIVEAIVFMAFVVAPKAKMESL